MFDRMNWLVVLSLGILSCPVRGDEPTFEPRDPAADLIDRLIQQFHRSSDPVRPTIAEQAHSELDDAGLVNPVVVGASSESTAPTLERAPRVPDRMEQRVIRLLELAREAESQGRWTDAARYAGAALRMRPRSTEIARYVESLGAEVSEPSGPPPYYAKGLAHLAAAFTRAQELLGQRRYDEGVDLLKGIIKASSLFPTEANVEIYRQRATADLTEYRRQVEKGLIRGDERVQSSQEEPILVATGSAAPENARRVVQIDEAAIPAWYSQWKNRLAFRMSVDYQQQPFALVTEQIQEVTGVPIMVDPPVRESWGHLANHVDFRLAEVPAETVLQLACQSAKLEYVIVERGVVITTPARAARYLRDLPTAVRNNWTAARVVFPDLATELLAAPPLPSSDAGVLGRRREEIDADLPDYLRSGDALVAHVEKLLRGDSVD